MHERPPTPKAHDQSPHEARQHAEEILATLMNRFQARRPLTSDEYCIAIEDVDSANRLFRAAGLFDQELEIETRSDHVYLPHYTKDDYIWPENTIRIPQSMTTDNPEGFVTCSGIFRGVGISVDSQDRLVLNYRLQTRKLAQTGFAQQIHLDAQYSLLSFTTDYNPLPANIGDLNPDEEPELCKHLEIVSRFIRDVQNDDGVTFTDVIPSIEYLLNKSPHCATEEFRGYLATLFRDAFPSDGSNWHFEAKRVYEEQAPNGTMKPYRAADQFVSLDTQDISFVCQPRMSGQSSRRHNVPRLRINPHRYDLYITAPDSNRKSTFYIPFSGIEDMFQLDE